MIGFIRCLGFSVLSVQGLRNIGIIGCIVYIDFTGVTGLSFCRDLGFIGLGCRAV